MKEQLEIVRLHEVEAVGHVRKITLGKSQGIPVYQVVVEFMKISEAQMVELFGLHDEGVAHVRMASHQQSFGFDHPSHDVARS